METKYRCPRCKATKMVTLVPAWFTLTPYGELVRPGDTRDDFDFENDICCQHCDYRGKAISFVDARSPVEVIRTVYEYALSQVEVLGDTDSYIRPHTHIGTNLAYLLGAIAGGYGGQVSLWPDSRLLEILNQMGLLGEKIISEHVTVEDL